MNKMVNKETTINNLKKYLEYIKEKNCSACYWLNNAICDASIIEDAIFLLENQSTYIIKKHALWIDMGDFEQCSSCTGTHLKEFQSYYGKTTWFKTPYCPFCGAKMDG